MGHGKNQDPNLRELLDSPVPYVPKESYGILEGTRERKIPDVPSTRFNYGTSPETEGECGNRKTAAAHKETQKPQKEKTDPSITGQLNIINERNNSIKLGKDRGPPDHV